MSWTSTGLNGEMKFLNSHSVSHSIMNETLLNISLDEYRQELSDQMAQTLLPALILLGIFLLCGVVGNSLVLYIYLTKVPPSATRPTILALACFDLLACFLSIPGEILDIRFSFNFMSDTLCKTLRLSTFVFLIASGLTLLLVALDRYHKICHPLRNQIKPRDAWKRVVCAIIGAFVMSALSPVVYANIEIETPTPGVMGMECSKDPAYKKVAFVYGIFLGLVFLATFTVITVAYIFIARRVLRQKLFRTTAQRKKPEKATKSGDQLSNDHMDKSDSHDLVITVSDNATVDDSMSQEQSTGNIDRLDVISGLGAPRALSITSPSRRPSMFMHIRSNSLDATTLRTTLMLFLITLLFVVSFMPHIILTTLQTATKSLHSHQTSDAMNVVYNIFIRSYFLNPALNPFIYGFCSPLFRRECKKLILGCAFWRK